MSGRLLLLLALAACDEPAVPEPAAPAEPAATPAVTPAEGTPDAVPHEQRLHEDVAHVNQPPGHGKAEAPPVEPVPHQEVPHQTMPAGAGPDGQASASPKPPPAEPVLDPAPPLPEVPPLTREGGETVWIRGAAPGIKKGQVRFTERVDGRWEIAEVNVILDGRFEVLAPAYIPNPVHVSVASDLTADGPTEDDLRGALPQPIVVGAEDIELTVPLGRALPAWAQDQDPPVHQVLDREAVLHQRDR